MKFIFKFIQRRLKKLGFYHGKIDGDVGPKTEAALMKVHFIAGTGFRRERLALAFLQTILNEDEADPRLKVDGLMGPKTQKAFDRFASQNNLPPTPASIIPSGDFLLSGVTFDPFHNLANRPKFTPQGIVLHRTAGFFATGDFKVGKWGHFNGPSQKRSSLSFHFLVGKEPGEVIQFVPIDRMVHHVRRHSNFYLGIEISGDVGQSRDGLRFGEPLTDWQLKTVIKIVKFMRKTFPHIRAERCPTHGTMFKIGEFPGLVGHRDLTGNTHADSPNKADWKTILAAIQ